MSHFGRSGPPDIRDTFSLLVLNISFRPTTSTRSSSATARSSTSSSRGTGGPGTRGVSRSCGTSMPTRRRRL
uniref:Arginine/serine-rich splicing factor SC31 transcript III n=1 Tax=Sorghum bicolor TaxID=4558 RepID=M1H9B0_SORBI|nr:arginine/serine-rich splicing factor SC31 transcript III [Sorghum bicolor]